MRRGSASRKDKRTAIPNQTRRTFRCRAWDLGSTLDWAREHAGKAGFAGVTVACEPTGHRWRVLGQLAADRGMS